MNERERELGRNEEEIQRDRLTRRHSSMDYLVEENISQFSDKH